METPRLSGLLRERGAGLIEVIRFWRAATVRDAVRVPAAFRDGAAAWRWGEAGRRVRRFARLIMRAGGRRRGAGAAKKGLGARRGSQSPDAPSTEAGDDRLDHRDRLPGVAHAHRVES